MTPTKRKFPANNPALCIDLLRPQAAAQRSPLAACDIDRFIGVLRVAGIRESGKDRGLFRSIEAVIAV